MVGTYLRMLGWGLMSQPQSILAQGTQRDLPRSGTLRVISLSKAAWGGSWNTVLQMGGSWEEDPHEAVMLCQLFLRLQEVQCGCFSSKPESRICVGSAHRRCVFVWRIHEPWLLPHDIWKGAISFFKKSPQSFISLTAQGKQVGWVLLLTTLSHVVTGGLSNVRTSLM